MDGWREYYDTPRYIEWEGCARDTYIKHCQNEPSKTIGIHSYHGRNVIEVAPCDNEKTVECMLAIDRLQTGGFWNDGVFSSDQFFSLVDGCVKAFGTDQQEMEIDNEPSHT